MALGTAAFGFHSTRCAQPATAERSHTGASASKQCRSELPTLAGPMGSAISFVVANGAKLRLWRDELIPPFQGPHHLHNLIPHLVRLARGITANQIANPD